MERPPLVALNKEMRLLTFSLWHLRQIKPSSAFSILRIISKLV
jgi:hypothetical protein